MYSLRLSRVVARQSATALCARASIGPMSIRGLATVSSWLDVTEQIKLDHDNVRDLFERYQAAHTLEDKKKITNTLIREMSIHGDAEEVSVYNDYPDLGLEGTVKHNKEEHAGIKKKVFAAEHSFTSGEHFDETLSEAVNAFLAHATEEETEQLPKLRQMFTPEQNDQVARTFLKARASVPKRPHPLAPQSGGVLQKAMGMHGRAQDTIVEGVQGREYVEPKYKHPEP